MSSSTRAPIRVSWVELGTVPPQKLKEAKLELHRVVQIVADVGRTYAVIKPDDAHTNLEYLPDHTALAGQWTPGRRTARALLQISTMELVIEGTDGDRRMILGVLPLANVRSKDAWAWTDTVLKDHLGPRRFTPLSRFEFPLPPGPGAGTRPFRGEPEEHFQELACWYANAHALLESLKRTFKGASEVRCWPHHFDIAFRLPVARGSGRAKGSIGIGLSPGDDAYGEPYWYVTPWPLPDSPELPALPRGGQWQDRSWTGAVLTGRRLVSVGRGREQAAAAREFLLASVAACSKILTGASAKS